MGNPVRTLVAVTGLAEPDLAAMTGRIVSITALILPLWLVRTMTGWRNTLRVWPGLAVCGIAFAGVQLFWSNYIDGTLVNVIGGMFTLLLCAVIFRFWQPKPIWRYPGIRRWRSGPEPAHDAAGAARLVAVHAAGRVRRRVGTPPVKHLLESTGLQGARARIAPDGTAHSAGGR